MKSTGIIRKIDHVGRLVLPPDICASLHIERGKDSIELLIEDDTILLRKYAPACAFCGSFDGLTEFGNLKICAECIDKIAALKKPQENS